MDQDYSVSFKDEDDVAYTLTVPVGFHTDLASIPPVFQPIFGTWGRHTAAAICHDCMYAYRVANRALADNLFESIMLADGVEPDDATVMATAVRLGGKLAWDSDDENLPDVEVFWVHDQADRQD